MSSVSTKMIQAAAGAAGGGPKYAYVIDLIGDAIEVFEVTDPANMTHVGSTGTLTQLDGAGNLAVDTAGQMVFAAVDGRVTSIDVSDPTSPSLDSSLQVVVPAYFQQLNRAYLDTSTGTAFVVGAGNSAELGTVNISNPSSMVRLDNSATTADNSQDVAIDLPNDLAHLVSTGANKKLLTLNVSNLSNITEVRSTTTNLSAPVQVSLKSGATSYLYVLDQGLNALSVYNAANLSYVGRYLNNTIMASLYNGVLDESRNVYFAVSAEGRVIALNVSSTTPSLISSLVDTTNIGFGWSVSLDVKAKVLYVTNYTGGKLTSIDVSNTASMSVLDSISTNLTRPKGVALNVEGVTSSFEL